jgi:hypothetical protein
MARFSATLTAGLVSAIQINGKLRANNNLSRVYNLAVPADVTALKAELATLLAMPVYGGSLANLTSTAFSAIMPSAITDIEIVYDGAANVEATRVVADFVRFVSGSQPSTGANITTIAYTVGAFTLPASAPTATVTAANAYGVACDFYLDYTAAALANGAAITHTVVDDKACTNTVNGTLSI